VAMTKEVRKRAIGIIKEGQSSALRAPEGRCGHTKGKR